VKRACRDGKRRWSFEITDRVENAVVFKHDYDDDCR
jgi:hypothetical protein